MKLKFTGDISPVKEGICLLKEEMEFDICENGREINLSRCENGFCADTENEKITLSYNTPADFYRGFCICCDAIKNKDKIRITQNPAFDKCGIMLDVSRGAVMKVEKIKDYINHIARMGFNELMLYTEDVYEVSEYPYFGYMRGRYTIDELREIVQYAKIFDIETVPCIQTLGHLEATLRWEDFSDIKDQPAVLMIGEEKTYRFIEAMIKSVRSAFESNKIHIGMDEAHGVGLGNYLTKNGSKDRFGILSEHLFKVLEICKKYNFEPMMWSDMFFRLGTPDGRYYSAEASLPDNLAELVPDDISQVYWDYYNNNENFYNVMVSEHKKMQCPIIFAGGVWVWSSPSANHKQTILSTLPALKVCKEQKIKHVFATLWADDGAECDMHQALYGLQLFSECNYNSESPLADLDDMFKKCTGCDAVAFKLLDIDDFDVPVYNEDNPDFSQLEIRIINTSKQALYQNPLLGIFDKNFEKTELKQHYTKIAKKLETVDIPQKFCGMFEVHKQLLKVLESKCDMGIRLKKAYDEKNKNQLEILSTELKELEKSFRILIKLRKQLWYENNKPFGMEELLSRLTTVTEMVATAYERVDQYLEGKIDCIEELQQERLWYNSMEIPHFMEYFSSRILKPKGE